MEKHIDALKQSFRSLMHTLLEKEVNTNITRDVNLEKVQELLFLVMPAEKVPNLSIIKTWSLGMVHQAVAWAIYANLAISDKGELGPEKPDFL